MAKTMLSTNNILTLLSDMMDYGKDDLSAPYLASLPNAHPGKFVTHRKFVHRAIHSHIKRTNQAKSKKTQQPIIIRTTGERSGLRYHKDDVTALFQTPALQKSLTDQYRKNTELLDGIVVPSVVAEYHLTNPQVLMQAEQKAKHDLAKKQRVEQRRVLRAKSTETLLKEIHQLSSELLRRQHEETERESS